MFIEIWKPVVGFEAYYQVSASGLIKRKAWIDFYGKLKYGKVLKPYIKKNGYAHVVLSVEGRTYCKAVHRLVAEAFIEKPVDRNYLMHYNANRSDNRIKNLRWVNFKQKHRKKALLKGFLSRLGRVFKRIIRCVKDFVTYEEVNGSQEFKGKEIVRKACCY